ncbi:hypothetical protein EBZ37_07835 [bacterium]|nr:hypothetical protein [bacterium]
MPGQLLEKFEWKVRSIRYYEPAPPWWSQDFGQITERLQTYAYLGIWILVLYAVVFLVILAAMLRQMRRVPAL